MHKLELHVACYVFVRVASKSTNKRSGANTQERFSVSIGVCWFAPVILRFRATITKIGLYMLPGFQVQSFVIQLESYKR